MTLPQSANNGSLVRDKQCEGCGRQAGKLVGVFMDYPGKPMLTWVLCAKCSQIVHDALSKLT